MSLIKPVLYQDLSKKAADLLSKDFPSNNKLQLNTRASNGASFEATIVKNQDDSIVGSVAPKFAPAGLSFARHGVLFSAIADTNRNVKLEAEASNFVHGLTTRVIGDTKNEIITLEGNYKHDFFTLNGSVDFLNPHGTNAVAAMTMGYEGFSIGLQNRFSNSRLTAVNGCAAYATNEFTTSIWGEFKQNRVGINYFQRVNPALLVGAEASFDLTNESSARAPKLTIGGRYEVDVLSGAFAKAKFDTDGRLAVSYGQRLNRFASLTVGGAFNTNSFTKAGGHNFGFTLALND